MTREGASRLTALRAPAAPPLCAPILGRVLLGALLGAALAGAGCSSAPEPEVPPAERIARASALVDKDHNLEAKGLLEELRAPLAGTALEGEVLFLLGKARFGLGEYADAEVLFGSYLSRFPDGPHAGAALFHQANCHLRQAERMEIGFFRIETVLPFDRDITPLTRAEALLREFLARYPRAPQAAEAAALMEGLREKAGLHELEVASFYLARDNPAAALARALQVEKGDFPPAIRERAGKMAGEARSALEKKGKEGSRPDGT